MPLNERPSGFVYLHDIDPSLRVCLRYQSIENFTGRRVPGYHKAVVLLHRKTALALCEAQNRAKAHGYSLVIYDGYRPQKAVNFFKEWSLDKADQLCKAEYYPYVDKGDLFDLGFIASRSAHSRGSAVDLTLVALDKSVLLSPVRKERCFADGTCMTYLDDNTVDMGVHFDFFGEKSFTADQAIDLQAQKNRKLLQDIMTPCGFKNYSKEWWHFQLQDEENKDCYYDFDVQ